MTGKIIKGIAGFYYVDNGTDVYECKAKGVFRNKKIKPLVGDNVEFTVLSEAEREGNIDKILPRKNELVRPAVANIDQALVIFSITHPEPNLNLLDRFLVMMEVQEVPVKICFNKTDLTGDGERDRLGNIYSSAGYPVYFTSTYENSGLDELRVLTPPYSSAAIRWRSSPRRPAVWGSQRSVFPWARALLLIVFRQYTCFFTVWQMVSAFRMQKLSQKNIPPFNQRIFVLFLHSGGRCGMLKKMIDLWLVFFRQILHTPNFEIYIGKLR